MRPGRVARAIGLPLASALLLAGGLLLGDNCVALAAGPESAGDTGDAPWSELDAARRLTWSRETRSEGIAALRDLAGRHPQDPAVRLELGRVLTWNETSRTEGVEILRQITDEHPHDPESGEALARVLSWDRDTRPEAIRRLRDLLAEHPDQQPARLLLAEILSWDESTRTEAIALYREALAEDPASTQARLGLAEALSWEGDRSASRTLYRQVLEQDPEHASAVAGLAEVELWSGNARASLETLKAYDGSGPLPPEILQRRAAAFADLDRPARALETYEAVLAAEPGNAAAASGAQRARRRLRPTLEVGGTGSTESGDDQTSKLEIAALPLVFSWYPAGDFQLNLSAAAAVYDNDRGSTDVLTVGAGFETPVGNHVRLSGEARGIDLEEADDDYAGRFTVRLAPHDRFAIRIGVAREFGRDSRLAAVGETIGGVLYGPVVREELRLGFSVRPGRDWDFFAQGARGDLSGDNVADNDRDAAFAGFGRAFSWGRTWLRSGYSLTWLSYDKDLSGYPPADLGGNGTDSPGVGGYFSPFRFVNHMARLDVAWSTGRRLRLNFGGGLGRQEVEDTGSDGEWQTSSDAYFSVSWHASEHVTWRGRISHQDVASAFDRTRAGVYYVWTF